MISLGKAGAFFGLGLLALTGVTADFQQPGFVDTPSPNDPIEKIECNVSQPVSLRYSSSSKRMYLEGNRTSEPGGCVLLHQIYEVRGKKGPLYPVDPSTGEIAENITGTWLLTESLYVLDGVTLRVWGNDSTYGDYEYSEQRHADELRLLSTPDTFINLRAHGGNLDFESTKVVAWDNTTNSVDTNETDGRSYISCVSEIITDVTQDCVGAAKNTRGECRMDIANSEMAYLGHHDSESYGLTWKVRGFCVDKSNPEVFDEVAVYGNIYDSELHHNNFAVYTYGHQGGDWRRNIVHSNSGYGFDPHDDSDELTIHDNIVYNNTWHGIIASKRCNNVSIQGNTVYDGGPTSAGIFLHRSSDNAVVKNNHCYDNGDAGMAFLESFNAEVSDNLFENNKYGVRLSVGSGNNVFTNNTFSNSSQYGIFTYEGSDAPDVVESGFPKGNLFTENNIVGGGQSMKIKQAEDTEIIENTFVDAAVVQFNMSTGTVVEGNEGLDSNDLKVSVEASCFIGKPDFTEQVPDCLDDSWELSTGDDASGDDASTGEPTEVPSSGATDDSTTTGDDNETDASLDDTLSDENADDSTVEQDD